MANLQDVFYLSEEQLNTLLGGGSITVGSETYTYDPNTIYCTPTVDISETNFNLKQNITDNTLETVDKTVPGAINEINEKIPSAATSSNQLADKAFVNSTITTLLANYVTKDAQGDPFDTYAELAAAVTFYSGGVEYTPNENDYCIVSADENHDNLVSRYLYNNIWQWQYSINSTPFTAAQLSAINSGITSADKAQIAANSTAINTKLDASKIIYSDSEPVNPVEGTLWLKPITEE